MANDSADSFEYQPLASSKEYSPEDSIDKRKRTSCPPHFSLRELLFLMVICCETFALLTTVLLVLPSSSIQPICRSTGETLLYSPAQNVVEYEVKSFTSGRKHKTIYQGLSDEVDHAWGLLYNNTILKIPKSEAILLPNKTYPIKDEPGYYIAGLDVFHQLHCLNAVRQALHKEYYHGDHLSEDHISHCVDTIRQSLMCSADISVNVWQWREDLNTVVGYSTQAHSCRNFNKIRDWAREHRLRNWIDTSLYVYDGLPNIPIIS